MNKILIALLAFAASSVSAQSDFPAKPIRIIVPFGAGSGTDTATRLLGQHLSVALGQGIVADNRPGASGSIAAVAVARAAPDGYTLLMGTNSTHGANPGLIAKMQYDPVRDFVPVSLVGVFNSFLVVHPSVPAKTVADLIAYGKAHPKALTFAAASTSSLMMGEVFARATGLDMLRIQYQSNPQGVTDVVAGRVSLMFPDMSTSLAHVRSGALRALAVVTMAERSPVAPELPAVAEIVPGFHFIGWVGVFAPSGTPPAIVDRLGREIEKVVAMKDFSERLAQLGAEAKAMPPAKFRDYVRSEVERLPKVLKDIGIEPQ